MTLRSNTTLSQEQIDEYYNMNGLLRKRPHEF